MKTSCYFSYFGKGRVGISLGAPRSIPPGFRMYRRLAPTRALLGQPYHPYRDQFMAALRRLNARQEWDHLHSLTQGAEPVLLCYERAPLHANNWCHRSMVAEWFGDELGETLEEVGHPKFDHRRCVPPADLFDEVGPFIGKECDRGRQRFKVIGKVEGNPGQALVKVIAGENLGNEFPVSKKVLETYFK